MLLNRDNDEDGFKRWDATQSVASGRAYCIVVRPGVTAVDFDWDVSGTSSTGAERADAFKDELERLGFLPVVTNSGGNGRAHVWCIVDANSLDTVKAKIRDYRGDLREANNRIRPPFAPHRQGSQVSLRFPDSIEQAIKRLSIPIERSEIPRLRNKNTSSQVVLRTNPPVTRPSDENVLAALSKPGDDRSVQILNVASMLYRQGHTVDDFISLAEEYPNGFAHKLFFTKNGVPKTRTPGARNRYLRGVFEKANWMSPEEHAELEMIMQEAFRYRWKPTENYLMVLCCLICGAFRLSKSVELNVSVRQLAEWAGIGTTTASRHLKQLERMGWISFLERNVGVDSARRVRLKIATESNGTGISISNNYRLANLGVNRLSQLVCPDLAEGLWGSLACKQMLLYIFMITESFSINELAVFANRSPDSCRNIVRQLETYGLVTRGPDQRLSASTSNEQLIETAKLRATSGRLARKKLDNARNRESFRRRVGKRPQSRTGIAA